MVQPGGTASTAAQRAQKKRRRRFDSDTAWVLSDVRGQRFTEELRVASGMDEHITPGPMAEYRLGRRSVGLELTEHIRRTHGPAMLAAMEAERDAAVKNEVAVASQEAEAQPDEIGPA